MFFCKIEKLKISFVFKKAFFSETKCDRAKRFSASERASKSRYRGNKKGSYKNLDFWDKNAIFTKKSSFSDEVIGLYIVTLSQ